MTPRFDHDAHCRCRLCHFVRLTACVAFLVLAASTCKMVTGCTGPSPKAAAYGAELQACVANSETRAAADECKAATAKRYGRDGGGHE